MLPCQFIQTNIVKDSKVLRKKYNIMTSRLSFRVHILISLFKRTWWIGHMYLFPQHNLKQAMLKHWWKTLTFATILKGQKDKIVTLATQASRLSTILTSAPLLSQEIYILYLYITLCQTWKWAQNLIRLSDWYIPDINVSSSWKQFRSNHLQENIFQMFRFDRHLQKQKVCVFLQINKLNQLANHES